jgi:hypothetical protein
MGIEIEPNITIVNQAENDTDWVGNSIDPDNDYYIQGSNSLAYIARATGDHDAYYTSSSSFDVENTFIRVWWMTNNLKQLDTQSSTTGIQIITGDGSNTAYYSVGGSDTYPGGWKNFVIDSASTPGEGTYPAMSSLTTIGVRHSQSILAKNLDNTWIDMITYGYGYIVKSGSESTPGTFSDIYDYDISTANAYGIIEEYGGIYYLQGSITFGSGSTDLSYFNDTNQVIVIKDIAISTQMELAVSGSKSVFVLGSKVGGAGVEGCTLIQDGSNLSMIFDAKTNVISGCRLYGTTIQNFGNFYLPGESVTNETMDCTFSDCSTIYPSTSKFTRNNIISAKNIALEMISGHNISSCNFISCPSGVIISSQGGNYEFNKLIFTNVNKHIVNATGTWISAQSVDSNVSSYVNLYGSTTSIVNSVYLTINVENEGGAAISTAAVTIISGTTQLMNDFTGTNGQAQTAYNYVGNSDITIRIRKSTPTSGIRYFPYKTTGEIDSSGYSLTAVLIEDKIAA